MTYFKNIQDANGIGMVFAKRNNLYKNILPFVQDILREPSYLDPGSRELIAAYVSSLNSCEFCKGSHAVFTHSLGVSLETIENVLEENYDNMKFKPIFEFVKKLTLEPSKINQHDVSLVLDAGFKEEELQDAIAVCAAFNMFNRIVSGHGIEENKDQWRPASERIKNVGYDARYLPSEKEEISEIKEDDQAPPVEIFMQTPML